MKLSKGLLTAPLLAVSNPGILGTDAWSQVDAVTAAESNLVVSVSVAQHPTTAAWDTNFWWHQISLLLEGEMTVQDLDTGAVYVGTEGDVFYFSPGLRAHVSGAFKYYSVKTPAPTRWVQRASGKNSLEWLRPEKDVLYPRATPDEVDKKGLKALADFGQPRPKIKFIKGGTKVAPVKVDHPGLAVDENWWNIALVNPIDSNLVLNAGLARHGSDNAVACDHLWHQMVLIRDGEMISRDLDTGEVFKAHPGDVFYWPPGLRHSVAGRFQVFAVVTPAPRRWLMTKSGKKQLDLLNLANEILFPGSPPSKA